MNLYSRVKDIEARMNRLKTIGLSSSSSLTLTRKNIVLPVKIIPLRTVSGEVLECGADRVAWVQITTDKPAFVAMYITDTTPLHGSRPIGNNQYFVDGKYTYRIEVYGSNDDLDSLNRGVVLPTEYYSFSFYCTSNFTYSITWVNNTPG